MRGKASLEQSDLDLIRVVEDLIDILLEKNVFALTDLPQDAVDKLTRRKHLRRSIATLETILDLEEEETIP
ncbi:MAG TPA: hypothetical protein VHL08_02955 [Dongiaceae bacterium]|jgi:hypothetical protein|nr:hypothetical protein [Dongiaceae bacterium]